MDIYKLRDYVKNNKKVLDQGFIQSLERDFELNFHHDSTKIEGNTLTIYEVKTILVDRISVGGKELREIYELINHEKAFNFLKQALADNRPISEELVKDIHEILVENIFMPGQGGFYRTHQVRIIGAGTQVSAWTQIRDDMKSFIYLQEDKRKELSQIDFAAWLHAEFVKIHPFADGNGRTARMILNYSLMQADFLPINIKAEDRPRYYQALDSYGTLGELGPFASLVEEYERARLMEIKEEIDRELI